MSRYKVKDESLAKEGLLKVEWAESRMPVLMHFKEKYSKIQPLKGMRIAGCLHVTKETAVLIKTLVACGAEVSWSGCNPLSTQDDIAAALVSEGISIYAWHGMDKKDFYECINKTLEFEPTLTLDDGADLIFTVHREREDLLDTILGGTEETTTGVQRLRAMAEDSALRCPVIAVNDSVTKWDFDNVYGTGQSSLDGILRASSILIAGKTAVVSGYGHCGRGVAMRLKGMGARVIVTEVEPTSALKATLEGYAVMPMDEAVHSADLVITATGMKNILTKKHFEKMKDEVLICNTGHYDCEINLEDLQSLSKEVCTIRPNNERYTLKNQKRIYVLGQGRLVNLVCAEGHPSEVMDMSFANQFLGLVHLAKHSKDFENRVYVLPKEMDDEVARIKLSSMQISIDSLSQEQKHYALDYSAGT